MEQTSATRDKANSSFFRKALKKILVLALKFSVSGGLLWLVLKRAGVEKVLHTLKSMDLRFFLAGVALYLLGTLVSSMRWRLFVSERLSLKKFFSLYLLGTFFSTFLPGVVGGDAFKGYYLYKKTGRMAEAMASIFMERYLGFAGLLIVAFLAYFPGINYLRGTGLLWFLPVLFLVFLTFSVFFFKLRLGRRIKLLADFYEYFGIYEKRAIFKGILLSLGVQGISVITVYTLSLGLGLNVSLPLFFVFVPLISTFSAIPLSISGFGIREASFVLLFGSVGVPKHTATALSFALFLSMAASSLPGLYEYLKIKKS
ncbi:MAG: lysylphosphatidylglycerol synthase transmembrane domain-containing protein [Nitrospiraceae bacterium]|nr:lysylphosphatidylglycerol synthase transmembrane domain-containing protein [Nitrospiraceae bacterium]